MILDTPTPSQKNSSGTTYITSAATSAYRLIPYAGNAGNLTNIAVNADRIHYIPFSLSKPETVTELATQVQTIWGTKARVWIYSNTSDSPDKLLVSTGDITTTSTGSQSDVVNYTLREGTIYWIALISTWFGARWVGNANILPKFGYLPSWITSPSYLYEDVAPGWTTLPTQAGSLTAFVGTAPVVYVN